MLYVQTEEFRYILARKMWTSPPRMTDCQCYPKGGYVISLPSLPHDHHICPVNIHGGSLTCFPSITYPSLMNVILTGTPKPYVNYCTCKFLTGKPMVFEKTPVRWIRKSTEGCTVLSHPASPTPFTATEKFLTQEAYKSRSH